MYHTWLKFYLLTQYCFPDVFFFYRFINNIWFSNNIVCRFYLVQTSVQYYFIKVVFYGDKKQFPKPSIRVLCKWIYRLQKKIRRGTQYGRFLVTNRPVSRKLCLVATMATWITDSLPPALLPYNSRTHPHNPDLDQ